jgi:hypothetical protein
VRGLRRSFVLGIGVLTLSCCCATAQAAFPGANGKIAFADLGPQSFDIHTINPDGTGDTTVTPADAIDDFHPAWSPDGARIAFDRAPGGNGDIYVIDADGTDLTRLTTDPGADANPAWSPDGSEIVFESPRAGSKDLWVMNANGSDQTRLTTDPDTERDPSWSPDGTRIAFASDRETFVCDDPENPDCVPRATFRIFTVAASGGAATRVTFTAPPNSRFLGEDHYGPEWSPSGDRLAYESIVEDLELESHLYTIVATQVGSIEQRYEDIPFPGDNSRHGIAWSPDGSQMAFRAGGAELVRRPIGTAETVTLTDCCVRHPSWQPLPINAYARPKGASPTKLSLVPAYAECTAPNRQHGPPLSSGSCTPPVRPSTALTVGTPDVNVLTPNMVGTAILSARADNLSTPADESDVKLQLSVTDVRRASDLGDYTGQLEARPSLRITDKNNTPHPGGPGAATTVEVPFSYAVPCSPTAATGIGSTCATTTTAQAILPGSVTGGDRAVWELRRFDVYDADGARFLTQGLFVP